ncbi:TIGR02530 family flagellar biosynthesis protein [Virgibacillus necropolis]|uniref:Flagellar protein n=1 Tax=Virgibacillus necropolis TaxID=163877 RepID=A0A221MDN3_9BACI|nr:TIGR02530 family flagellar biosynthesis protein [Virgibacillus necropolis]ASN05722.1 flagellar protein [Virgibacillus necropolis]
MDHRIHQTKSHALQFPNVNKPLSKQQSTSVNFKDMLVDAQTVKVSKHAKERLQERNITFNDKQWQTITEKMVEARNKGITDSLVVTNDAALLVSTKNHTVVTAMNREEATNKIFTNINGTILINE